MKKIYTTLVVCMAIANISYGQWNATVPGQITTSDKIGIGTVSPIVALDISGYNTSKSQLKVGSFELQPYSINNSILYNNAYYNGSVNIYRNTGYASALQFVDGSIIFNTAPSGNAGTTALVTPKMSISSIGNVGVGTTSPQTLVHINSETTPVASQFRITANGLGSISALNYSPDNTCIAFDADFATTWTARNSSVAWLYKVNGMFHIMGSAGNSVGGTATQNSLLNVNLSSGNVGIGTASPDAKLAVNGTIHTKEVKVNTGWSDYVFDKEYQLRPITEIEAYIKKNHPLPDVPTTAEVKKMA